MADFETLTTERQGPILRVGFNRPERHNALNGTVLAEVEALFSGLSRDFETRVVILFGHGPNNARVHWTTAVVNGLQCLSSLLF